MLQSSKARRFALYLAWRQAVVARGLLQLPVTTPTAALHTSLGATATNASASRLDDLSDTQEAPRMTIFATDYSARRDDNGVGGIFSETIVETSRQQERVKHLRYTMPSWLFLEICKRLLQLIVPPNPATKETSIPGEADLCYHVLTVTSIVPDCRQRHPCSDVHRRVFPVQLLLAAVPTCDTCGAFIGNGPGIHPPCVMKEGIRTSFAVSYRMASDLRTMPRTAGPSKHFLVFSLCPLPG
ncbi:hypothetical protein K491DRAFT_684155 [Lophiostoma macrostomum CBS 122681]|uniref:Uncharacterized protein n=1 Tax=Lophiostoma macrostomum CBS 122681 TaxID=1314788 RepID=A0A6A6SN81_9PLEO|nr:hypothetical protein K491DRAFT_684155 [Lophiostoma macrostomum CBS 122681]